MAKEPQGEFWPIDLLLDGGLGPQHVLGRGRVVRLGRNIGIAVIDHLEIVEDVEIEFLDIGRGISGRLLTHPLGRLDPEFLFDPGVERTPARCVGRADDDHVGALQLLRMDGDGAAHEARHVLREKRIAPALHEIGIADRFPVRIAHQSPPSR
jgi:hypothetical protein